MDDVPREFVVAARDPQLVAEGGPRLRRQSTACAFGGDDLGTLYLSLNYTTLEDSSEGCLSGVIAVAEVGRVGAPVMSGAAALLSPKFSPVGPGL